MPGSGFWSRMTGGGCNACCAEAGSCCSNVADGCCGQSFDGAMMGGMPMSGGCAACQGGGMGGIPAGTVIDGGMSTGQVYPGSVIQGDIIPGATFDPGAYGGSQLQPTPAATPYGANLGPTPAPGVGISPPPSGNAAPMAPVNAVPAT